MSMMKMIATAACLALSACATPMPYPEARAAAERSQDWELCYVAISGRGQESLRYAVRDVMMNRRTDCNQHMAIVSAKMQQDATNDRANADMGLLGLQLMRASQPRPVQPAPTMQANCRTFDRGGYLQTICD